MTFMKSNRMSSLGLGFALASMSFGQGNPTRFLPIQKDPPKAMYLAQPLQRKALTDVLQISVSLEPRSSDALQAYADSVSDPNSPSYRQFLTPTETGVMFGLPQSDVNAIVNYLKSQGMKIKLVASSRMTILAAATVQQAQNAFHTTINEFRAFSGNKGPAVRYSFSNSPEIPAEFASKIINIGGLENFTQPRPHVALTPDQLRSVYSVAATYKGGFTGSGRTIGISNFDGFRLANLPTLYTNFKLPTPSGGVGSNVTVKAISGGSGSGTQSGEGDLDIQTALSMAPLSNLVIYDGGNNDVIGVLTQELQDNTCDVITESYGWTLDAPSALSAHKLHLLMTTQGITYIAASGDTGTDSQGFTYPNIDPEVLSIGGTSVTVDGNGKRVTEVGWNNASGAGGGGWDVSNDTFNKHPSWQVGTGVPTASKINYRLFPDVSLDADPATGYLIYNANQEYQFGGTSAASPTFAGALADSEQQLIKMGVLSADKNGNFRYGRLQDLIYSFNGDSSIFYDVTSGTNGTLPDNTTSKAGVGWDTVSGWGAMNFAGFIARMAGGSKVQSLTLSPTTVEGGTTSAITGTVTLNGTAGSAITVSLTSDNASVTVPATVVVAKGASTASFKVTTTAVATNTQAKITATSAGASVSATLTVNQPSVKSVVIAPSSVIGGSSTAVTGTVTITRAAPANGLVVALASDNTSAATVAASVTVPAGKSSATFPVTSLGVASINTVHVTATVGTNSGSGTLTVNPPTLSTFTLSAKTGFGGDVVTGTVMISGKGASGGTPVALSLSNDSLATLSSNSAIIASGSSTGTFTLTIQPVDSTKSLTVTAKLGSISKTAVISISPAKISTVSSSVSSALGGVDSPTITVTLNSPAGPSGAKVSLVASPATAAKFASSSLTIQAGSKTGTATLTTLGVSTNTSVSVTGTLNGSAKASVMVTPAVLTNFTLSSESIKGGSGTLTATVTLSGPAGSAGRAVTLTSSNGTVLPVPSTVTVPAGKSSVTVTLTPKQVSQAATVTVSAKLASNSMSSTLVITP